MTITVTRSRCDLGEQLIDVEPAVRQGDDSAAADHRVERRELPGAVHQRAGDEHHVPGHVGADPLGHLVHRRRRRRADHRVAAGAEHVEQVVLAPHDALRHASRAAGVQQQQVVAAALPRCVHPLSAISDDALVRRGPLGAGAGLVGHHVPAAHLRQAVTDALEQLGERGVEHDGLGIGVVEQVEDLLRPVAEVGVHRDGGDLEGGDHRLHVLRAVVQVAGHLGLLTQSGGEEVGGERVRPADRTRPR